MAPMLVIMGMIMTMMGMISPSINTYFSHSLRPHLSQQFQMDQPANLLVSLLSTETPKPTKAPKIIFTRTPNSPTANDSFH